MDPSQTAGGGILHTYSTSALWPYTKLLGPGRRLELLPSVHFHYTDASDDLERHPSLSGRMTARYAVRDAWRWELALERRADDDDELAGVASEEWRAWLACTSTFGPRLTDETPLR